MPKSKFENIPIDPISEKKSAEEIKKEEPEEKEHIELGDPKELFRLKQGDEFLIPGSDHQYRLSVKYRKDKITAREKGTSNIIELNNGDLNLIILFTPFLLEYPFFSKNLL